MATTIGLSIDMMQLHLPISSDKMQNSRAEGI
ncbi:uncharacterized protein G2W53_006262 [Senna tora]|uniref:Uncharacterized protein n=1 Tax=Senna tora TaxID=362788 RepID=A0A835CEM2_9FABA|nr:uncharacterized protein G2W53_006262 [Senna tora]